MSNLEIVHEDNGITIKPGALQPGTVFRSPVHEGMTFMLIHLDDGTPRVLDLKTGTLCRPGSVAKAQVCKAAKLSVL